MRENKFILCRCDCGMHFVKIEKLDWNDSDPEYAISFMTDVFHEKQGIFNHLRERILAAAHILFNGHHRFYDIVLSEEEYKNFVKEITKEDFYGKNKSDR